MRKLLMTVLALALILGSISMASAASGKVKLTDIADNTNEEAIQVAYDLGIVTGTPEGAYEPEKAVNRAEFAALIVRALAVPDSALSSYTTTTFKDTSGYGWAVPYLAILQQKGIMKGDGYGNAMPGRQISPNEAVTMVLRAIGYTDNASVLVGQWPANYVSLGQSLNLYENVSNDVQMNKASAAQMIYNVLTAQLVQVDANSTVKLLYDAEGIGTAQTLLTTGLNCRQDMVGAVTDTNLPEFGKKVITYADASSSKINLIPKVGAFGKLYRSKADGEAVAFTEVETVFLAGKFTYASDTFSDKTENYLGKIDKFSAVDGTAYNLGPDAKARVGEFTTKSAVNRAGYLSFYNGNDAWGVGSYVTRYHGYFDSGEVAKYITNDKDNARPAGNDSKLIIAAKVSGVTILEVRSVAVWNADDGGDYFLYEAGQVDSKRFNGHDFPLDVNNERDDYGYVLAGVNTLDDIQADNVVYIYKNSDKKIKRIEVGTETQSGAITNINKADKQRTIGGKVLGDSPYHHLATWSDLEYVNNEGTALLDIYGRTFAFHLSDASKGNFAVYLADQGYFDSLQAKIFDKTGKEVVYGVKDQIIFNRKTNSDAKVPSGKDKVVDYAKTQFGISGNVHPLIEYKLSGGSVSELRVGTHVKNSDRKQGHVNKAGTIITIQKNNYLLDSSTLVYVRGNDDEFSIGSVKDLLDKDIENDFWYILDYNKANVVKALIVSSDDAGAQNIFIMINSVTDGSDGAGGEIDVVNGFSFEDGVNATVKSWSNKDDQLGRGPGRYDMPVKFRIGEDGVLKVVGDLNDPLLYDTNGNKRIDGDETVNPVVSGAALIGKENYLTAGSGGTFTLAVYVNKGTNVEYYTFEANTVLYKKDGAKWAAYAPSTGSFNNDDGEGVYTFLKTDVKKGYDIIVKTN
jgi:hypothetical protein